MNNNAYKQIYGEVTAEEVHRYTNTVCWLLAQGKAVVKRIETIGGDRWVE